MKVLGRLSIAAALSVCTLAAQANEGVIDHRQAIMRALGGHFGATISLLKGEVDMPQTRAFHAESLKTLAQISAQTFPVGSEEGEESEARPEVWTEADAFAKAMDEFQAVTAKLAVAASGDDRAAFAQAVKAVGGSCKSCHDDFKSK